MKTSLLKLFICCLFSLSICCSKNNLKVEAMPNLKEYSVMKTEEEWRKKLNPDQYIVLREAGTEQQFSGQYNMHFKKGIYKCAGCDEPLFDSESKFNAHCGWPSFDREKDKIIKREDISHGIIRTEISCPNCGGHLGHVFDDGPTETGLRYCVNSLSLDFDSTEDK